MHVTFKNPCKYGEEFENNCNARLLTKPPQTRQEMGHSCTTDKLISTLLHKKKYILKHVDCFHGDPNVFMPSNSQSNLIPETIIDRNRTQLSD